MSVPLYYISQHIKCNKRKFRTKPLHTRLTTTRHVTWIRNKRRPVVQWQLWSWRYARMSGADPQRGPGQSPWSGVLPHPETESFFLFGYPKRAFFTPSQNFVNFVNHTYFKWCRTNRIQWFTMMQLFVSAYQLGGPNQIFVWVDIVSFLC